MSGLTGFGRGPLVRFVALTFGLSWIAWLPLMLARLDVIDLGVPDNALVLLAFPGVLMPGVAAVILSVGRTGGGVSPLMRRLLIWRVRWSWWAFVLFAQPAVLMAVATLWRGLGGGGFAPAADISGLPVTLVFLCVASIGEELGWRGYVLPRLRTTRTAVASAAILGLVASTWHLPYWILQGVLSDYGPGYLALDYLFVLALTLQITIAFDHTRGSVLVPVVFHLVFNVVNVALLPVTSSTAAFGLLVVLEWLVAGVLAAVTGHNAKRGVEAGPVEQAHPADGPSGLG